MNWCKLRHQGSGVLRRGQRRTVRHTVGDRCARLSATTLSKMRPIFPCLLLLFWAATVAADELRTLIAQNCLDCHDNATHESGLSLESLGDSITAENASIWLQVLKQIERRTMPPAD